MKPLAVLLERLRTQGGLLQVLGTPRSDTIHHLTHDSRQIRPGGLFAALKGVATDGHLFIDKAVQNGAVAIVCEVVPEDALTRFPGTAFVHVRRTRREWTAMAAAFYDDPAEELRLVGVTGTNGKTTTTHLIYHILMAFDQPTGLMGTIANYIGTDIAPATHTTPDAAEVHRLLRQMVDAGCTACVMEVSSHALEQGRVVGIAFDVAVFTNLTRDHLDYHGTFKEYLRAKKRLFDGLAPTATALVNTDDPAATEMIASTAATVRTFGLQPDADFGGQITANQLDGLSMQVNQTAVKLQLVGAFNAYNALAAYGAVRVLGYEPPAIRAALSTAPPVAGRFEHRAYRGVTVIVDYAHTPDALENVLVTTRELLQGQGRLWCVFGCGGDRDPTKRRTMGSLAERYADRVIVTSDNPRTEDPEAILNDIRRGMEQPRQAQWIVDREAAIRAAAEGAQPGDAVLIAGKGHEAYQIVGQTRLPFDDREMAARYFQDPRPPAPDAL
ncbi:MAG: UDP-N-acetylmuramoyl-L-alanyl-D-glutamate--2,6-diaminopimelate ligase [Bacteroidota bacterium]